MGDVVERLRRYAPATTKPSVAKIMDEAADEIEALRAERDGLRAAISWIEEPFIDESTPESELRNRVKFCAQDAARATLKAKIEGGEEIAALKARGGE